MVRRLAYLSITGPHNKRPKQLVMPMMLSMWLVVVLSCPQDSALSVVKTGTLDIPRSTRKLEASSERTAVLRKRIKLLPHRPTIEEFVLDGCLVLTSRC